jgi:Tfp pilus assembly protein PilN
VSPIFEINFRREAHRQELSRARRRATELGTWVAYFGVLAVVLGLYGLNCHSLAQRVRSLEARNARLRTLQAPPETWKPQPAELAQVEGVLASTRRWRSRLERLAAVLPANVRLASLVVNPDNLSAPAEQERLVISGVLDPVAGQDRMQGIMQLVSTLHGDSLFAAQYRIIKLVESRTDGGSGAPAEFRIECRR